MLIQTLMIIDVFEWRASTAQGKAYEKVYKNPHCAACHGIQMNLTRCFRGSLKGKYSCNIAR